MLLYKILYPHYSLDVYSNVVEVLKPIVRKFGELILIYGKVTGKKLLDGTFLSPPAPRGMLPFSSKYVG